jgi:hypothetical protein
MGRASPKYCKSTPVSKMGFTQKASCRAQGLIPRASKKYKGKYVKSTKYQKKKTKAKSRRPQFRFGVSLYASGNKKPQTKTGYGSAEKARMTIKNIRGKPKVYQLQVVNTMYNRAKYHKYQTSGMREAMKIFRRWLSSKGY